MGDDSSVRVALRIRPLLPREVIDSCKICTSITPDLPQVFIGGNHAFTYDFVFDTDSRQDIIYTTVVRDLVESCLDGYNATILAYGQTGSGKTFTMGTGFNVEAFSRPEITDMEGIIPRAVAQIFQSIDDRRQKCILAGESPPEFRVVCQFIEIYNEEIVDLLGSVKPDLNDFSSDSRTKRNAIKIHENSAGCVYLAGVATTSVNTATDAMKILRNGALSRTTGSTNMNNESSRSHAIFTLTVTVQRVIPGEVSGAPELETLTGKFNFVDLAGSERLKRTGAVGDRAKEGISINCGLLALGNVISALDKTKKISHVPYRDSKLTRLLQDSLGGNSKTLMIACVSPCDRDFVETLNTMKYANRAKNIKNKVVLNQDKASRTIAVLKLEIEQLQQELAEFRQGKRMCETGEFSDAYNENLLLTSENSTLRSRLKAQQETIEMLTIKNSELLAEKETSNWESNDLTPVVQQYMKEIEGLKAKLCESEATFEDFKKKPGRISNYGGSITDLISQAKREVMMEQRSSSDDSSEEDEEDEPEKLNKELADVTNDIVTKERLIEQLELSQQRMDALRSHYEEKLNCLLERIKVTERERDQVLAGINGNKNAPPSKIKQVKEDYEKKLNEMANEVKRYQSAHKEHLKQQKAQNSFQVQIQSLKSDLENMKRLKVRLMNQMKDETQKHRLESLQRNKEIAQLKKDQRKKANLIKTLENDKRMKEAVIKRKYEELNVLKNRNNKKKFSPVKTKAKWVELNRNLNKNVSLKTTVDSFEREMLNLIEERGQLEGELREVEDLEIAENIKANIVYLDDKIGELQNSIILVNSEKEDYEGFDLFGEEAAYILKKFYDITFGSRLEVVSLTRKNEEFEGIVTNLNNELITLRELMKYMLMQKSTDETTLPADIAAHLVNMTSETKPSAAEENLPPVSSRKARRLTSTTQELLGEMPSNDDHLFVNPNHLSGLNRVQSSRSASRLTRRDTYSILPDVVTGEETNSSKLKSTNSTNNLNATYTIKSPNLDTSFLDDVTPPGSPNSRRRSDVFNRLTGGSGVNSLHVGTIKSLRGVSPRSLLTNTHIAEGHTRSVLSVYATNDKLFTGSKDTTAKVFDLQAGKEVTTLNGHPTNVTCIKYSQEFNVVLTASSCFINVFDLRDKNSPVLTLNSSGNTVEEPDKQENKLEIPRGECKITTMMINNNRLYTNYSERVRIWDMRNFTNLGLLNGKHVSHVMCLASGPQMIVSGSKDHYIKVYDLEYGESRLKGTLVPPHYDGIESLALSNKILISGSRDTCIKKWDLDKMELLQSNNNAHTNWITGLTFAPNNDEIFLSTCRDGFIKIWSLETMRELSKVEVCKGAPVNCICVNSRLAFTGTNNGTVKVWRWNDHKYRNDVMTMSTGRILGLSI